jgi:hypothetical protein
MLLLGPLLGSFCEYTFTTFSGLAMFVSAALIDLWQRVLLLSLGRLISVALHHLITPGSFFLPRKPPVLPGVPAPRNFRQFESVAPVCKSYRISRWFMTWKSSGMAVLRGDAVL